MSEPPTRFTVGAREGGKRLDRFLHERIPGLSRTRIQRAIRERVTLSWGAAARPATPVRPGGEVLVGWTPLEEEIDDRALPILARGRGWLAVDKPAGIPVHPVNSVRENSLIRMLRRQERDDGLRLVHRLDRETTGVLLVAEDGPTASALSGSFMRGDVHKEYLALVGGRVEHESGEIDLAIGNDERSPIWVKRAVRDDGQPAHTGWRVERREAERTLLRLFPATGRRHQLRVHLDAIGHPVLGDPLYGRPADDYLALVRGEPDPRVARGGPRRQLLHCARLVLPDATGTGRLDLRAPLPQDFALADQPR